MVLERAFIVILKRYIKFSSQANAFLRSGFFAVSASLFVLGVLGCAHCPLCGAAWPARGDRTTEDAGPVVIHTIVGKVSCLERVMILPTFEIRVQLVTLGSSTDERQVVAECLISEFQEFPVPFELIFTSDHIEKSVSYGLVAELLSQGTPLLATDAQYKVNVEESALPYDLVIVRNK